MWLIATKIVLELNTDGADICGLVDFMRYKLFGYVVVPMKTD